MTNKVVNELNNFLADLAVFYQKLLNYHWNVNGKDFFVFHEKLEEYYNEISAQIDEIGEHILILGEEPLGSMKDYLENAEIREAKNEKIDSCEILKNIEKDFEELKDRANRIKEDAEDEKDYITSGLMDDYLMYYSKVLWMLKQHDDK